MFGMRLEPGIARASRMSSPSNGNSFGWARPEAIVPAVTTHRTRHNPNCRPIITLPFPAAEVVGGKIRLHAPDPGFLRGDYLGEESFLGVIRDHLVPGGKLGPKHGFAGAGDNDAALPDLVEILRIAGIGNAKLGGRCRQCGVAQDRLDLYRQSVVLAFVEYDLEGARDRASQPP